MNGRSTFDSFLGGGWAVWSSQENADKSPKCSTVFWGVDGWFEVHRKAQAKVPNARLPRPISGVSVSKSF